MSRLKSWAKQTEGYRETRQRVRPQHQRDRDEDNNEASFGIDKKLYIIQAAHGKDFFLI